MTAHALPHPAPIRSETDDRSRGWIHTRGYDLALFTLSPLAGLFVLWANARLPGGLYVVLAATYFVAIPHYLSSFTFYLGDQNLSHTRTHRAAFVVGPLMIFAGTAALRLSGIDAPVQVAMFVWNIYHVALQSAGILSLYRRLNGGLAAERPVAHLAILAVNATCAFWFPERFPPLHDLLIRLHPWAPWALRGIALPVAVGALAVLGYRLVTRPRPVSLPEASFLASSLLLFHPYLWVKDSNLATFGMLMGHFIQYLGIVWLFNRRKYAQSSGSARERWLGRVSANPKLLGFTILTVGITFYLFNRVTEGLGAPMTYVIAWNAMTLVHFYLDGLIWAFRRPYVRETVGPYLTLESHRLASAA
ncbi:MAG: hypothetical protein ACREMO_06255 [Gemmatimonadales bacterium]